MNGKDVFLGLKYIGDDLIEKAYDAVFNQPTNPTSAVNHPTHYNREGGMECIDEMVLIFGKEAVMYFCLCNAWKYRYRAADKNGVEDLKKSDWYLAKYKELRVMHHDWDCHSVHASALCRLCGHCVVAV